MMVARQGRIHPPLLLLQQGHLRRVLQVQVREEDLVPQRQQGSCLQEVHRIQQKCLQTMRSRCTFLIIYFHGLMTVTTLAGH